MMEEDEKDPLIPPEEIDDHLDHADEILKIKLNVEPL